MHTLSFLLLGAFLFQESASTSAVLTAALDAHFSVWAIHGIFLGATLLDIVVGYGIGVLLHGRLKHTKAGHWLKAKADGFRGSVGKQGERVALALYSPLFFPFSMPLLPFLGISFTDALIYPFLGELLLWYALVWVTVLGVHSFVADPKLAPLIAALVSTIIFTGFTAFHRRAKKRNL
jgi:hypothetical protein